MAGREEHRQTLAVVGPAPCDLAPRPVRPPDRPVRTQQSRTRGSGADHLPAAELRPHLNLATATMLPAGYVRLQECPFPAIAADEATKRISTFGPTTVSIDGVAMLAKTAFLAVVLASTLLSVVAISAADPSRITPNDPLFRYQISFDSPGGILRIPTFSFRSSTEEHSTTPGLDHNIVRAWSITTGSKDVVVALLDDGFFYQHEDLKDNIWHNPGETGVDAAGHRKETNGVDDDRDGYVDDVVGWDFAFDDPDPDAYIFAGMDASRIQPYGHGTAALVPRPSDLFLNASGRACPAPTPRPCRGEARLALVPHAPSRQGKISSGHGTRHHWCERE